MKLTYLKLQNLLANSKVIQQGANGPKVVKLSNNNISEELIKDLAKFIAKLHNLGIYFKANHLANIIYNDNFKHKFGLIDIDNIKFFGNPLEQGSIIKNFGHMTRYQVDRNWLLANSQLFFDTYLKYSKSSISTSEIKNLVATQV